MNPAVAWLTTAGTLMGRVWLAVQAFGSALRKEPLSARTRRRHVRAGHAAVPRPSPPKESGELPETYGRTKVVAMVVSPYLVHVYWDLAPQDRAAAGPATLRFHDTAGGDSFDVNVDLAARSWYVHLWSPDKHYSVELGWQRESAFAPLAQSNPIETPRAWPVADAGPPEQPVTRVVDLAAQPTSVLPPTAPQPPLIAPPPLAAMERAAAPPVFAEAPREELAPLVEPAPPGSAPIPRSATMTLQERLAALYRFRLWPRPTAGLDAAAPEESLPALLERAGLPARADFTARLEAQFSPGLSSVLLGLQERSKPAK